MLECDPGIPVWRSIIVTINRCRGEKKGTFMQQFQEPRILTNTRADYQLLKTRGRAPLILPFRSTNTPSRVGQLPRTQSQNTIIDFNSIRVARFNSSRTKRNPKTRLSGVSVQTTPWYPNFIKF